MTLYLNDLEKTPFWDFSPDVYQICKPLFDQFGLNYFEYSRFYSDNTCITFFSEREYVDFYLNNAKFECPQGRVAPGKYIWSNYIDKNFLEQISTCHDHYHGITYVRKKYEYTELFNFAASKNNANAINIFLNYDNVLEYFLMFFLKTVEPFIKNNQHSRIILPESFIGSTANNQEKNLITSEFIHRLNIQNNFRKNNYFLKIGESIVNFTAREFQCMSLLIKGSSAKTIARILAVSPRTIETYCANILKKSKALNRVELLSKLDNDALIVLESISKIFEL